MGMVGYYARYRRPDLGNQSFTGALHMNRFLTFLLPLCLLSAPATAQQSSWLWWGTDSNHTVPVSNANPLPVTGAGGTPSAPTGSVQYNNAGAFGGTSLLYDSGTGLFSTTLAGGTQPGTFLWGFDPVTGLDNTSDGMRLSSDNGYFGLGLSPADGTAGYVWLEMDGVGSAAPFIILTGANGTVGSLTAVTNGQDLGTFTYEGYNGSFYRATVSLDVLATQDWSVGHYGSSLHISTAANDQANPVDRIVIDGSGNTNVLNGNLIIGAIGTPESIVGPNAAASSNADGGSLTMQAGTPDGTGTGGSITITGGPDSNNAASGGTGAVTISGGTASFFDDDGANVELHGGIAHGNGAGGATTMQGGVASGSAPAGVVQLTGGQNTGAGAGGGVSILGGQSTSGAAGDITLETFPGTATTGNITFAVGSTGTLQIIGIPSVGTGTGKKFLCYDSTTHIVYFASSTTCI